MEISFDEFQEQDYIRLQRQWNELTQEGSDPYAMSHYELANMTNEEPQLWKEFLIDPRVSKYLEEETEALKQQKIRKIIAGIDANSKSPGTAQTLNALLSSQRKATDKDGPAFIYCYIPLSSEEKKADNVKQLTRDPFAVQTTEAEVYEKKQEPQEIKLTDSKDFL